MNIDNINVFDLPLVMIMTMEAAVSQLDLLEWNFNPSTAEASTTVVPLTLVMLEIPKNPVAFPLGFL